MFKDDDEQDDNSSITNSRYPCMPSLVALQQMRNRLHLAYVGKKLMKWTAQATGRELRKLAWELTQGCAHFREEMRDAFMLLARSRYFYPNLNKMVLEYIGRHADITVEIKTKTISGVKTLHMEVLDSGQDNYQHLGIDKGGQAILEAKKAWRDLLKRVIMILELRTSFAELDLAQRSATKKKNVLAKVIIPKLKATIKFIVNELEEMEREEVFRLKRFKQLKTKRKSTEAHICCCCLSMFASEDDVVESTCPVCKKAAKAKGKSSDVRLNVVPCKSAIIQGKENKKLLDHLMSHIDDVIGLTRQYKLDGIVPASIDKFIKTCSQVKETIEDYANAPPLCDVCKKFLETTSSKVKLASRTGSSKSLNIPCAPKISGQTPPCTESCYNLNPETDDKLGYFEKKFKEIVKVTRLQNEDGSVSEEKQVITIRTERRNPRKTGTFNSKFEDEKFVGPGGGRRGNIDYGGGNDYGGGKDHSCGKDYGSGTDYGGDGGPDFQQGPRETKSEHFNRSHQMGEPRLRSCMSASHPKSTLNKDASTNFDSRGCVSAKTSKVTLPPSTSTEKAKNICGPLPKVSKASSVDSHICCPRKTASVCGSALESGPHSQASINSCSDQVVSCKPVTASASAQTCCREVPVKKHKEDKGTCCLPICGGEKACLDNKDNKFKTTSTEAIWRDAFTSTTDLNIEPSKTPSKRSSKATSSKASPVPSCASNASHDSNSDDDTGKRKKRGNCCTIKIIAKPPKICCLQDEPKEPEKEVFLPGSMFEQIKSIFLPPTKSNESCQIEPEESEIKNICKNCISKLCFAKSSAASKPSVKSQSSSCKNICISCPSKMSSVAKSNTDSKPSVKSQSSSCKNICTSCLSKMSSVAKSNTDSKPSVKSQSSSCKICQASVPSEEEVRSCPSCGSLAQASSCGSMSCKSMGIGSSTSHTCSISARPEPLHNKRHTCCLEKKKNNSSDEEDENTCCAMAQTNKSSKSICCSKKKSSSVCCPAKASVSSIKSTKSASGSCNMKADASTCTKRSARFDVRPVSKHTCEKVKLGSCTCKSDPHLDRSRGDRRPVKRSQSFYEDEYYYFKW